MGEALCLLVCIPPEAASPEIMAQEIGHGQFCCAQCPGTCQCWGSGEMDWHGLASLPT